MRSPGDSSVRISDVGISTEAMKQVYVMKGGYWGHRISWDIYIYTYICKYVLYMHIYIYIYISPLLGDESSINGTSSINGNIRRYKGFFDGEITSTR